LSGLATLHTTRGSTSASGAPSADRGEAQLVLELHERQLQHLDNLGKAKKLVVPHGLAAAERDGRR
jgi:hypothetical protein